MINTKLVDLLKKFSAKELKAFREFVESPYFNRNKDIRQLCGYLSAFAPDYTHSKLTKEGVFKKLFLKEVYSEQKINSLVSQTLQLAYQFLIIHKIKKSPVNSYPHLLEELLHREALFHARRTADRFEKAIDAFPTRSYDFAFFQWSYYEWKDQYFMAGSERSFDPNLQLKDRAIDRFYLLRKLRIACDMVSRNKVIKASYHCNHIEQIVSWIASDDFDISAFPAFPALEVYLTAYELLQNEHPEPFFLKFRQILNKNIDLFPKEELWVLYNYALNFCISQINSGKSVYYQEVHQLYQEILEQELIYKNGYLTQWDFKNIVTVGLRIRDFEWTRRFIETYIQKLLPEEQQNAAAYNMAALFFEQQDYHSALQTLHHVEFTDSSYHLGAKIIQVKSYFTLNEGEALYALLQAFRKYISRNKSLGDYKRKANLNFINFTKQLFDLKENRRLMKAEVFQYKLEEQRNRLQRIDPLANKSWLEQQVEAMDNE